MAWTEETAVGGTWTEENEIDSAAFLVWQDTADMVWQDTADMIWQDRGGTVTNLDTWTEETAVGGTWTEETAV